MRHKYSANEAGRHVSIRRDGSCDRRRRISVSHRGLPSIVWSNLHLEPRLIARAVQFYYQTGRTDSRNFFDTRSLGCWGGCEAVQNAFIKPPPIRSFSPHIPSPSIPTILPRPSLPYPSLPLAFSPITISFLPLDSLPLERGSAIDLPN